MYQINKDFHSYYRYNVLGMMLDKELEEGMKLVNEGNQGKIFPTLNSLDNPSKVIDWGQNKEFIHINALTLKYKTIKKDNFTIISDAIFSSEEISALMESNKILFIENYSVASKEIRQSLLNLIRYGKLVDIRKIGINKDGAVKEAVIQCPNFPLIILDMDDKNVQNLNVIDEFEKSMLRLEELIK